jgi:hypothetical protein
MKMNGPNGSFYGERTPLACGARRRAGRIERLTNSLFNEGFRACEPVGGTPTGAAGTAALPIFDL